MTFTRAPKLALYLAVIAILGAAITAMLLRVDRVSAQAAAEKAPKKEASLPGQIELKPEAVTRSDIGSEAASERTIRLAVTAYGIITLNDDKAAHVVSQVAGIARDVPHKLGNQINKGDVLCVLESRELAEAKIAYVIASKHAEIADEAVKRESIIVANTQKMVDLLSKGVELDRLEEELKNLKIGDSRAQLISAYAKLKLAKQVYEREKTLVEKKISASSELLVAEEDWSSSEARFKALIEQTQLDTERGLRDRKRVVELAHLDLSVARQKLLAFGVTTDEIDNILRVKDEAFTKYELRSPVAGTIIARHVSPGESVTTGADLFFIADLSTVWGDIALHADRLKQVKLGQKVIVTSDGVETEAGGELMYLGSIVDEKSGNVTGRVAIENKSGGWRPGLYIAASVVLEEKKVPQAVSVDAIQLIDNAPVVFVQNGNTFSMRKVKLGLSDGRFTEIIEGVRAGEMCVVRNSFVLKAHILSEGGE